jgi:large conductance mechanosensitive channel
MDMAVGVIIGGAFGKIVSSLVDDIIMPVVGVATGGVDFTALAAKVGDAEIKYGLFIQNIIDFLIIAFSIFCVIKAINKFKKKEEPAPEAPAGPTTEELLADIKEILKKK